jgi:phosphoribosylglycinamide formyltransferase-1
MQRSFNVVVCASGGGGNFQALIDRREEVGYKITLLIADRPCGAIDRAIKHGIPFVALDGTGSREQRMEAFDKAIPADTDLIVLAGFLPIIPAWICEKWPRRIINTHPSLLPKYGGKGMVGVRVQEAVMRAGEGEAGCTVHYVSPEIDAGEIILQKSITVDYRETPWQLGGRVFIEENRLLVEAVRKIKAENGRDDGI